MDTFLGKLLPRSNENEDLFKVSNVFYQSCKKEHVTEQHMRAHIIVCESDFFLKMVVRYSLSKPMIHPM